MRILVCGGRTYGQNSDGSENTKESWYLYDILEEYYSIHSDLTIIQGGARGADSLAKNWAVYREVLYLEFPAEWGKYGLSAGMIRNTRMLDEGHPDLILAFPGGRGTANMIKQGKNRNIPVRQL